VSKGQAHEYWQSIHAGAIAAANESGVAIQWNGPASEADVNRQVQIVNSMIAQHLDGIALAPVERQALVSYVERAEAAKIPVTIYDSGIDTDRYLSFVATNNYKAGELAARKLGQLLDGKGSVLAIKHMPGSASSMEREEAFRTVIAHEFPSIHIVAEQFGMGDRDKVLAVTENLLTAHPNANAIFASAESSSAGAVLAVKERHLAGKIILVGFDSSPDLIDALRDGTISALVAQDPFRIGYEAVKTLADHLAGKKVKKHIDLDAIVITKQDLDRPEIHAMLFPDLKKYLGR
jgi:ribose transport system substrate-binding protein